MRCDQKRRAGRIISEDEGRRERVGLKNYMRGIMEHRGKNDDGDSQGKEFEGGDGEVRPRGRIWILPVDPMHVPRKGWSSSVSFGCVRREVEGSIDRGLLPGSRERIRDRSCRSGRQRC